MFLLRTVFWLTVIVVLLPTDARQQTKLYDTASAMVHQAATFCDRNGEICAKGAQYWATFCNKLAFGTRLVIDIAAERLNASTREEPAPARAPITGTLTRDDLAPAWRGPQIASGT